jgi:hypothetical protein
MKKRLIYALGLITLLIFPIPTFIVLYFFESIQPLDVLELSRFNIDSIGLGIVVGGLYAVLALGFMTSSVFDKLPTRIESIVKNMNLTIWDCLFLSVCAGVGEELLFRSGVQFYLGPVLTSVIFVAIHGYLNPFNWRMSLYGLVVLPFILIISYGLEEFGLWFCISAHFFYDFVLFYVMTDEVSA